MSPWWSKPLVSKTEPLRTRINGSHPPIGQCRKPHGNYVRLPMAPPGSATFIDSGKAADEQAASRTMAPEYNLIIARPAQRKISQLIFREKLKDNN